jgi:hypothetical protein
MGCERWLDGIGQLKIGLMAETAEKQFPISCIRKRPEDCHFQKCFLEGGKHVPINENAYPLFDNCSFPDHEW